MYKAKKLISKRNKVMRVQIEGDSYIKKTYRDRNTIFTEKRFLELLKQENVKVPSVIEAGNEFLILQDLGEVTMLDWFEKIESENNSDYHEVIMSLIEFMDGFYKVVYRVLGEGMSLYDMNLRNFILVDKKVYRVDFEQTRIGSKESDAGKLLAYIMTYDPQGTEWKSVFRRQLLEELVNKLNLEEKKVIEEEVLELENIRFRRMRC